MNLYTHYLKILKKIIIKNKNTININSNQNLNFIIIEKPPEKFDCDFSSNAAMILGKILKKNPRDLALILKEIFEKQVKDFSEISIAGPGFLNFKLNNNSWIKIIENISKNKNKYGSNKNNKKFNIEFVSANPTGPLHIGHCRGAIFGDVLSNLLKFNGNKVTKEFYINDYGNQINIFTKSVFFRLREIKNKKPFPFDEGLYPGKYIIDIAQNILKTNKKININNYDKIHNYLKKASLNFSLKLIKSDLKKLGIKHDYFFSESNLIKNNSVKKTIEKLKKEKFVIEDFLEPPKSEDSSTWEKKKRLIFKSTLFGDDSNRALQKNDGSWTYFANDVAYHSIKISKKYDNLVNILGADHTGYIKRITAAVSALSKNKTTLTCKVCQLVKLYKNGNPFKMSKRQGDFISVEELLSEVNKDSIRFMMLNRGNDVELDFDFDKVKEKTKENPVFYVQYSYARINSLFTLAKINLNKQIKINIKSFYPNKYELTLLRKILEWPRVVELASSKLEPHRIQFYLYDLVTIFHSYWSKGNENQEYKFIIENRINRILSFKIFQLLAIVLENAMKILGVSLPKKM
tara:strand:+ start:3772 stop:5496 length:1725 start_codon:yes stop_codon:yes gene_type:complete